MRIIIACRAIDNMAGGVERQAILLANEMTRRGHHVILLTLDPEKAQAFYDIDPNVQWLKLGIGNPKVKAKWTERLKRMTKVRKITTDVRPNIILAFQQGMFLSLRLYTSGMGIPVIAAERESPYRYDFTKEGKNRNLIFQTYRLAPYITVQCSSYINGYPVYLRKKIITIPNSVYPAQQYASPKKLPEEEKILLCVGRLTFQKNQLVLIDAFKQLEKEYPQWKLILAGEGEYRSRIEKEIRAHNLEHKIKLLGAVKDISALYCKSHVLCIPSRWEGFPNVLAEALAHGLPAVGYQDCGGVRDLIEHGQNGLLAEGNGDIQALIFQLKRIFDDDALRSNMGHKAIESIKVYYPQKVYDKWESFLHQAAEQK